MSFSPAPYIPVAQLVAMPVEHEWDDDDPYEALGSGDDSLSAELKTVSDRARKAFAIAVAEWVIRRFGPPPDEFPLDYLEASWAGLQDWELQQIWEPPQDRYRGPAGGAIDLAVRTVTNCHTALGMGGGDTEGAFLSKIAVYVIPDPGAFLAWRAKAVERLKRLYPRNDADPMGPPVPREALDPAVALDALATEKAAKLGRAFVAGLDFARNKFLVRPGS